MSKSRAPVHQLETQDKYSPLVGRTLYFLGHSRWTVTRALTSLNYQIGEPPFEARQVFECTCICDPENAFGGLEVAILKLKYQIKGTDDSVSFHEYRVAEFQRMLSEDCGPTEQEWRLQSLREAEEMLYQATQPVKTPHRFTSNEIIALRRLRKKNCSYTPHLLDNSAFELTPHLDDRAMVGGFLFAVLMTKVPGKQIDHYMYWYEKREVERDEIREAFKAALLALWSCRIDPQDCALRNIMWDEEGKKCYLVDFEDWTREDIPDPEAFWDITPRWSSWQLSEEWGPQDRRV